MKRRNFLIAGAAAFLAGCKEVGDSALYLLSDLGRGTSGEVLHVDSGYHVVGMKAVDAPDISVVKDE